MERAMMKSRNPIRSRLVTWTVLALAISLVLPAAWAKHRKHKKRLPQEPDIVTVVVMNQDPGQLLHMGKRQLKRLRKSGDLSFGPFDGPETVDLWVVTVFDRRQLSGSFDQVTRFILPDGHVYETRTTPVEPGALPGTTVMRRELAEVPVPVASTPRMKRIARMLPRGTLRKKQKKNATFTKVRLPVSGTWITKHNLYGTWKVEVETWQDGKLVSSKTTRFVVRNR